MKILHLVGFHPDIGGPYSSLKGLIKYLYKLGVNSGICSVIPQEFEIKKVGNFECINEVVRLKSNTIISKLWPSYTSNLRILLNKIQDYDLIHIHGVFDYYAYFTFRYLEKTYIVSPHGTLMKEVIRHSYLRKQIYMNLFGKKILKSAKVIHALTTEEKNEILNLGIDEQLVYVIPNGIDPDDFSNLPDKGSLLKKFPHLKNKKIVLFLSRINWKKGLDDLIPAFADVVKAVNNAHLILAGPDNEGYMSRVRKWIDDYDIKDSVSYLGPVYGKDKLMLLQDCEIFVLPSYSEGFPMSVIEAMYMKLPVVVTENIGIPDVVRNSQCGIVINKNRKEISGAIIHLLKNKDLSIEMGERGRRCIEENFLWDRIAREMLKVYEQALMRNKV